VPKTRRLSDANLVRRSQQGDRRAFGALVGRYDWRLRGLAFALLLDRGEMDAALASAYLRAWRDVVRISTKDDVPAWLYRISYNACVDRLRLGRPGARPVRAAGDFAAGLAALPDADRVALVLVDREGFGVTAAARIMGVSPAQVESRVTAARARIAPHVPVAPPAAAPSPKPAAEAEPAPEPASESDENVTSPEPEPAAAVPRRANGRGAPAGATSGNGRAAHAGNGTEPPATDEPAPDARTDDVDPDGTDDPVTDEPVTDEPVTDEPGTEDAGTDGDTDPEADATSVDDGDDIPPEVDGDDAAEARDDGQAANEAADGDAADAGGNDGHDVAAAADGDAADAGGNGDHDASDGGNGAGADDGGNGDHDASDGGNGAGAGAPGDGNRGRGRRARKRAAHAARQAGADEQVASGDAS
jgi:RNA polymerase sigma-70 factor (ECF subfamily)